MPTPNSLARARSGVPPRTAFTSATRSANDVLVSVLTLVTVIAVAEPPTGVTVNVASPERR